MLDVKVRKGADVGSDHHLVTAFVNKLKLRGAMTRESCRVKGAFIAQLKNRFQALVGTTVHAAPGLDQVNSTWKAVSTVFTESSKTCPGFKKARKKKWIMSETWKATENRRSLKKKLTDAKSERRLQESYRLQYREADRTVKRMARANKGAHMDDIAIQADGAAKHGELGKVDKITKMVRQVPRHQS